MEPDEENQLAAPPCTEDQIYTKKISPKTNSRTKTGEKLEKDPPPQVSAISEQKILVLQPIQPQCNWTIICGPLGAIRECPENSSTEKEKKGRKKKEMLAHY